MLARLIRLVALAVSLLIVAGWGLFAVGEARSASRGSQQDIRADAASQVVAPTAAQERARAAGHTRPREAIDDANDVLLRPFAQLSQDSASSWVRRTLPAVLALIVYGLGLVVLAGVVGRSQH